MTLPTTLESAESQLSSLVHAATKLLSDLEAAGLLDGDARHARQRIVAVAVEELRMRWRSRSCGCGGGTRR